MRKGLMQDYANQIAQMFVGYQIELEDLPRLLALRQGRIEIDLLGDLTTVDDEAQVPFAISDAVTAWYQEAIRRDALDESFVREIRIVCDFDVSESRGGSTAERRIKLNCRVIVVAETGTWVGVNDKSEIWRISEDGPFWTH
jgi:hypothetical protein